MPSTATITTFYTFTANTKARASQANANFSIFRGHIIPVDPNTATSITNTYDLGSSEWRWRSVYSKEIDILSNTTTGAALKIYGETNGSNIPSMHFGISGTDKFRINQYGGYNSTLTVTTDGSDPGVGGICLSSGTISTQNIVTQVGTLHAVAGTTLTISTIGRPLEFFCVHNAASAALNAQSVRMVETTTTAFSLDARVFIATALTTTAVVASAAWGIGDFSTHTAIDFDFSYPLPSFGRTLYPTVGAHTFYMLAYGQTGTLLTFYNWKLGVREIR